MVVMVVTVMMERLMGLWGNRGGTFGVLAMVVMVLPVGVVVSTWVPAQFLGVVLHAPGIRMVMLLAVGVMAVVVVVRAPVALKSPLLLQLLLDVWGWRVSVGRGTNQGLHCVLGGQVQRLWVYLLVVPAVGHPVQFL